jgi:hypothetical protein
MKRILPVLPFVLLPSSLKLRRTLQDKLRFSVVGLLFLGLSTFSLSGMEKEKQIEEEPIHIRTGMSETDPVEDKNADVIMAKLKNGAPISEITELLNTRNININSSVISPWRLSINTILSCALEYCNPNKKDHVKLIKKLILEKGATLKQPQVKVNLGDGKSYVLIALENAIRYDMNFEIIDFLIEQGADVNFRYINEKRLSDSALHRALRYFQGKTKCIDYLLEKGADANAFTRDSDLSVDYDKNKLTPLALWTLNFIYKHDNQDKYCTIEQFKLVVKKLLEHDADINNKQRVYDAKTGYIMKSNYELLKPLLPNLDDIIKKVEDKKKHNISVDFANAPQNKLKRNYADHSVTIKNQEFRLNEAFLSIRCPSLCKHLNPDYMSEADRQRWLTVKEVD